jgi:hypothetical protein
MLHYELLFSHSFSLDDPLQVGDAFRYKREVWQVAEMSKSRPDGETDRAVLRSWPNEVDYPATIYGESA